MDKTAVEDCLTSRPISGRNLASAPSGERVPSNFERLLLIGAAVANPWVELFEPKMNFVFADARIRQYSVLNRAPTTKEPARWTANYDDPQHRVYGVWDFYQFWVELAAC